MMLICKDNDKNLGKLKYGKPYNFTFTLQNTGTENVIVTKLALSCGSCTKAQITNPTILPGETSTVQATFTPGSTGYVSKSISVIYNNTELKLKFKALI